MIFSGLTEVGDIAFYYLFSSVPGEVVEVDKKKCMIVFFGDERKKAEVDYDLIEKIVKKSSVVITQVTLKEECSFCENKAVFVISKGRVALGVCDKHGYLEEAIGEINFWYSKKKRKKAS